MSSWAQNFNPENWQLKHELAYWKAKATSLEYENKVLHDVIRKNHVNPRTPVQSSCSESEEDAAVVTPDVDSDDDLEVSEEFIEFLRKNAKFREDARSERERLKAQSLAEENCVEEESSPARTHADEVVELKELYGDEWQRIAALEMHLQSHFIQESDADKTVYWPNIPLNL